MLLPGTHSTKIVGIAFAIGIAIGIDFGLFMAGFDPDADADEDCDGLVLPLLSDQIRRGEASSKMIKQEVNENAGQ